MKVLFAIILAVTFSSVMAQSTDWSSEFQLRYSFAGLGSNTGTSAAGFKLEGNHFEIVKEVNKCYEGGLDTNSNTVSEGELSDETMKALMLVFNDLSDTAIYETNLSVMSGGVHTITMATSIKMVKISLHNANHALADRIVAIINEDLPEGVVKLWLY
jgi:hypothetical protein